jgi:pimeloyl-ACP methyl ester carboxylesterase
MRGDAELFADTLQSFLIDPHGSGESTAPAQPAEYSPEGHARFYEEVRQALGLDSVLVLGHSFGGTVALTYAALFPLHIERCIAVAAFGMGTEIGGEEAEAAFTAALDRHASAPWYAEARPIMDEWTERVLATNDPAEVEQMMAAVLPFYMAHPERPDVAAGIAEFRRHLKADLAADKAWEGGLYQTIDLRPLLSRISCPTLVIAGEQDFISGPHQARPIASAIRGARLLEIPDCGHFMSVEAPAPYRTAVLDFLSAASPV